MTLMKQVLERQIQGSTDEHKTMGEKWKVEKGKHSARRPERKKSSETLLTMIWGQIQVQKTPSHKTKSPARLLTETVCECFDKCSLSSVQSQSYAHMWYTNY